MTKEDRTIHELKIQEDFANAVYVGDKAYILCTDKCFKKAESEE